MAFQRQTENRVLGGGEVWVDDGDGLRHLGDTPNFTFTQESETLQYWDSDTTISELKEEVTTQITRSGNVDVRDISPENFELFLTGTASTTAQTGASAATETFTGVKLGRAYNIGATNTNPVGERNLSSVSVTDQSGAPSYTEGTDYELDLDQGLIQILEGGGISEGDDIEVTYDSAAVSWEHIESGSEGKKTLEVYLRPKNRKGDQTVFYMPKVEMRPDGDFALKSREDWQQMSFSFSILSPDGDGVAIYADGEPYTP